MTWLASVEADFEQISRRRGAALYESLKPVFGDKLVTRAATRIGQGLALQSSAGKLRMAKNSGNIFPAAAPSAVPAILVKPHVFYGRVPKT